MENFKHQDPNEKKKSIEDQSPDIFNVAFPETSLLAKEDNGLEKGCETKKTSIQPNFAHYQILQELGRGGMGIVYKAFDLQLKRIVALKVIVGNNESNETIRLQREAAALAQLEHPNIVRILEAGLHPQPYFSMEYIEGENLSSWLKQKKPNHLKILKIFIKLANALSHAHKKGFLHRDIKPSNIMINQEEEPKIMDFGLAKSLDATENKRRTLSKTGDILGTPSYMSPEQAEGDKVDPKSDIYSLGATLYEALTEKLPFDGESYLNVLMKIATEEVAPIRKINPSVSPYLEAICMKCLQKKPEKRYADAKQLARDLHNFINHRPILAKRYTVFDAFQSLVARKKVPFAVFSFILFLAFIGYIGWVKAKYNRIQLEKTRAELEKLKNQAKQQVDSQKPEPDSSEKKLQEVIDKKNQLEKTASMLEKLKNQNQEIINKKKQLKEDLSKIKDPVEKERYIKERISAITKTLTENMEYKNSPEGYWIRIALLEEINEYQAIVQDYKTLIEIYKNDLKNKSQVCYKLAYLYHFTIAPNAPDQNKRFSDNKEAIQYYTEAIKGDPQNWQIYHYLGKLYLYEDPIDVFKSIENFDKAISIVPDEANNYMMRGIAYFRLVQIGLNNSSYIEKALENLNIAVTDRNKENYIALVERSKVYFYQKKDSQAIADLDLSIEKNPTYQPSYLCKAYILATLENIEDAELCLKKAEKCEKKQIHDIIFPKIQKELGNLYSKKKDYKNAILCWKKAVRYLEGKDKHNLQKIIKDAEKKLSKG
ncbi:MAG: protein kinase [Candidatus Brocadiae bacterium]|nr:protein kinase [Candidatus Brocadiia bacterium]